MTLLATGSIIAISDSMVTCGHLFIYFLSTPATLAEFHETDCFLKLESRFLAQMSIFRSVNTVLLKQQYFSGECRGFHPIKNFLTNKDLNKTD